MRDRVVGSNHGLDRLQSLFRAEIGDDGADSDAVAFGQLRGDAGQAAGIAGDEDEIVASGGEAVGIDGADAGGCAGDEDGAVGVSHCPVLLWFRVFRSRRFDDWTLALDVHGSNVI